MKKTAIQQLKWFVSDGLDSFDEGIKVSEIWEKINELLELEKNQKVYNKEYLKQETLEEASSRLLYSKYPFHPPQDSGYWKDMFLEGAKWQQEQDKNKYSEKDMKIAFDAKSKLWISFEEFIEQFNK
jgi:hypothetical protein